MAVRWASVAELGTHVRFNVAPQPQRTSPAVVPSQSGPGTAHVPCAAHPEPSGYRHWSPGSHWPDAEHDAPGGDCPAHPTASGSSASKATSVPERTLAPRVPTLAPVGPIRVHRGASLGEWAS